MTAMAMEPIDSERVRMNQARHAVFEAWKAGAYAKEIGSVLGFFTVMDMVDDAITAVRLADAESDALASDEKGGAS